MGYYEDRRDLWESIPGVDFLDREEKREASDLFSSILADVEFGHMRPQDSPSWGEFLDLFGFDPGDAWDWDVFAEWYDSTAG